ncbi:hypothetical protein [Actinocatenispora rupis]|uniref:Uncharacterized protein n=1 Tax=Actinocatenispora rupis TaxID=519421 RepID=A0A8J3JHH5_9ACTN|nr:hypothetical protein [Actinocatenispora rupis]GID15958.1 hypothetical protein Aru02nite_68470 [Actinocatenispora rupis]
MRMTVGPLPAGVYWRRRVIVLGALLVVVLLLAWACGDSGGTPKSSPTPGHGGAGHGPANGGATGSPGGSADPTMPTHSEPPDGLSTDGPQAESTPPPDDQAPVPRPTGPAPGCSDDDMSVTVRTASERIPAGSYPTLFLTIGNGSSHACTRDIGADAQELWITHDGHRVWSSDYCKPNHGKDVRRFDPGVRVTFHLIWDGRGANRTCSTRTTLSRGDYELHGRAGGAASDPSRFALT